MEFKTLYSVGYVDKPGGAKQMFVLIPEATCKATGIIAAGDPEVDLVQLEEFIADYDAPWWSTVWHVDTAVKNLGSLGVAVLGPVIEAGRMQ